MKKIIVDVYGGIGNQIFQISFANFLKQKGYEVKLCTKINKEKDVYKVDIREEFLPIELFGFEESNSNEMFLFNILNSKFLKYLDPKNYLLKPLNKYLTWQNDINFNLNNLGKTNRFTGYWQDPKQLLLNKKFLISSISRINEFQENEYSNNGLTALHVRRGDYLNIGIELDDSYYKHAIEIASREIDNFEYEIFSDDIDWVKSNKIFSDCKNFRSKKKDTSALPDFLELFCYKNFIISNSTFSLVPALLVSDSNSKVIYPDPWIKNKSLDINFDNWIKISL